MAQTPNPDPEIAFFDVETTIPTRPGAGYSLLEFGAILVCPKRLVEVGSYSTLICPSDPDAISASSVRCNGITKETVATAPVFKDVAGQVYSILHGRVWAGHNIVRFDCARIREAFAEIGRAGPEAKGMVDTLPLLRERFGRRAGDMKMATLATYFGLGRQKHRSLDDVRMNLEVVKHCAAVLFLESSFPDVFSLNNLVHENNTPIRQDENDSPSMTSLILNSASSPSSNQYIDQETIVEVCVQAEPITPIHNQNPADLVAHIEQMTIDSSHRNSTEDRNAEVESPEIYTTIMTSEGPSGSAGFLGPDEVSLDCITSSQVRSHYYGHRIFLLHREAPLQICCSGMRVHFGISTKFLDYAGRPKLSIVVSVPTRLSQVLDVCDNVARNSSADLGSSSEWRPVIKKNGYSNSPSIRLHIPTVANGDATVYSTEIYKREQSGDVQKLVFSRLDTAVLEQLFIAGTIMDAYFFTDIYDFQQYAGIRLVAKRLVVHPM